MKTFDLPASSRLKVAKVTPRKEKHGKELVQAVSLRLEWWPTENSALNLLHPGLQDMLFWTPPEVEAQCALEGIPPVKKHRRVPTAGLPLKIEASFTGYTLTIEHGIDETSALELYGCALDKFDADAKEGGSSCIRWSLASNKTVTPELVGELCALEGLDVIATLKPPAEPQEAIDGSVKAFHADHPDAGDMFAAEHGGENKGAGVAEADPDEPETRADAESGAVAEAPAASTSKRTARGREATKKALEAGMAAAGAVQ